MPSVLTPQGLSASRSLCPEGARFRPLLLPGLRPCLGIRETFPHPMLPSLAPSLLLCLIFLRHILLDPALDIWSFNTYLLSTYYAPGTVRGLGAATVNTTDTNLCP